MNENGSNGHGPGVTVTPKPRGRPTSKPASLERWLCETMKNTSNMRRITLTHEDGETLRTYDVSKLVGDIDEVAAETAERYAEEIFELARCHAEASGGVSRYRVSVYGRKSEPVATMPIGIATAGNGNDLGSPSDLRGLVTQLMRHNEALMRMSIDNTRTVLEVQRETIAEQNETLRAYKQVEEQSFRAREKLANRSHKRDLKERLVVAELEAKQSEAAEDMAVKKQAIDAFTQAMAGITKQQGVEVVASHIRAAMSDVPHELLVKVFEHMSPEQQDAMRSILGL